MTQVDIFKVEVSYSGNFADLEEKDWRAKVQAKLDKGIDAYHHNELWDDATAEKMARSMTITNKFPCNHIAEVKWAEIRQEEE